MPTGDEARGDGKSLPVTAFRLTTHTFGSIARKPHIGAKSSLKSSEPLYG